MSRLLKILVGCDFSGTTRAAFERRGWEAHSCDFLPTEKPSLFHHQCDIREIIGQQWDLAILHPDCRFLVTSGNRWFYDPEDPSKPHPLYPNRQRDRQDAIDFVKFLWGQKHIPHLAIENPMGILPRHIGSYSQVIHPYQFGHNVSKSTCLWTRNLPLLKPTKVIAPRITADGKKRWGNQVDASGADKTPPGKDRWKIRARTYPGISQAFADQWGAYIENGGKTKTETWRDARECSADHYLDMMDSYNDTYEY